MSYDSDVLYTGPLHTLMLIAHIKIAIALVRYKFISTVSYVSMLYSFFRVCKILAVAEHSGKNMANVSNWMPTASTLPVTEGFLSTKCYSQSKSY